MMNRRSNVVAFPIEMEDYATRHAEAEPTFVVMVNVRDFEAMAYCKQNDWQMEYDGKLYCLLIENAE